MKLLPLLFSVFLMSGCAFNSVFFPSDKRPDEAIDIDYSVNSVKIDQKTTVDLFQFPAQGPHKASIIVFQGSGNKVRNWYKVVKPLNDAGYQLFIMEYPGFGNSTGIATHDGVVKAANIIVQQLGTQKLTGNKPLLALGQSYGGQLAIHTAVNNTLIDAVVIEGTFTSFSDEAAWSSPEFVRPLVKAIFSEPYRAEELIEKLNAPLLVIHSEEDKRVPFYMGQTLHNNASSTNKELWPITGKHLAGLRDFTDDYVSKVDSLLLQVSTD